MKLVIEGWHHIQHPATESRGMFITLGVLAIAIHIRNFRPL